MKKKNIHKSLIALLVFANVFVVTLFLDFYILRGGNAPNSFLGQLGNVIGVSAGVQPNEYNTIVKELSDWEKELDTRDQALAEREILLSESSTNTNKTSIIYITAIGLLLMVLIIMNFVLDWRRFQEKNRQE